MFNMMTLDGFFEGPNGDISWHNVDEGFHEFAIDQLNQTDLLLFGRVTYDLMAGYWPTKKAIENDPIVAGKMNSISKVVFSKTLEKTNWSNTRLIKENVVDEVSALKQLPGKDMGVFGSSNLTSTFIQHGLIDEYRIMVNPMVLGGGKSLFNGVHDKLRLKLLKTKTLSSGNVMIEYEPLRK